MSLSIWEYFLNEQVITDKDIVIYYYLNYHTWDALQQEWLSQYHLSDPISILIKCGFITDGEVKEFVLNYITKLLQSNKNLMDDILKELSHDITKQRLDSTIYKSAPLLASPKKHKGYSLIENDVLIKFDERDLVDGEYKIPEGIVKIENYAFMRCSGLKKITIPNSVKYIGFCAFAICKNLENITTPDSVTEIDAGCFFACINLKQLILGSNVTYLPTLLCCDCKNLTNVKLSSKVRKIERDAFLLCDSIENINIPSRLQEDWNNNKFKSSTRSTKQIMENILNKQ